MVKKENNPRAGNASSLLQTASNRRLGAGKFALLALRGGNGTKPPVKRITVPLSPAAAGTVAPAASGADDRSKISDLTGSVADESLLTRPALIREVVNDVDVEVESSVMGMSADSAHSSEFSLTRAYAATATGPPTAKTGGKSTAVHVASAGAGSGRTVLGPSVKTNIQPSSSSKGRYPASTAVPSRVSTAGRPPAVKKQMELNMGLSLSAPSPMTLNRFEVQMGQEKSAPESKEYLDLQARRRRAEQRQLEQEHVAIAKRAIKEELKREFQREKGEGFEAQLEDFDPGPASVIKKKSLMKQILGKIRPKSPQKKRASGGGGAGKSTVGGGGLMVSSDIPDPNEIADHNNAEQAKDASTTKLLSQEEAKSMARKAMTASRQRAAASNAGSRVSAPAVTTGLDPHGRISIGAAAAALASAGVGASAFHGSTLFPVNEVTMKAKDDSVSDLDDSMKRVPVDEILMIDGEQTRDDESVSTLGTPRAFEKLDHLPSDSHVPAATAVGSPERHDPIPGESAHGGTMSWDGSAPPPPMVTSHNASPLIDQLDSGSIKGDTTTGTAAAELSANGCNPINACFVAQQREALKESLLSSAIQASSLYQFETRKALAPVGNSHIMHAEIEEMNEEGVEARLDSLLVERDVLMGENPMFDVVASRRVFSGDSRHPQAAASRGEDSVATTLSPTSAFSLAIDNAIRNAATHMRTGPGITKESVQGGSVDKVSLEGSMLKEDETEGHDQVPSQGVAEKQELDLQTPESEGMTSRNAGKAVGLSVPTSVKSSSMSQPAGKALPDIDLRKALSAIDEVEEVPSGVTTPQSSRQHINHFFTTKSGIEEGVITGENQTISNTEPADNETQHTELSKTSKNHSVGLIGNLTRAIFPLFSPNSTYIGQRNNPEENAYNQIIDLSEFGSEDVDLRTTSSPGEEDAENTGGVATPQDARKRMIANPTGVKPAPTSSDQGGAYDGMIDLTEFEIGDDLEQIRHHDDGIEGTRSHGPKSEVSLSSYPSLSPDGMIDLTNIEIGDDIDHTLFHEDGYQDNLLDNASSVLEMSTGATGDQYATGNDDSPRNETVNKSPQQSMTEEESTKSHGDIEHIIFHEDGYKENLLEIASSTLQMSTGPIGDRYATENDDSPRNETVNKSPQLSMIEEQSKKSSSSRRYIDGEKVDDVSPANVPIVQGVEIFKDNITNEATPKTRGGIKKKFFDISKTESSASNENFEVYEDEGGDVVVCSDDFTTLRSSPKRLNPEEEKNSIKHGYTSEPVPARSEPTDIEGLDDQGMPEIDISKARKPSRGADVFDFVFEYSEMAFCGKQLDRSRARSRFAPGWKSGAVLKGATSHPLAIQENRPGEMKSISKSSRGSRNSASTRNRLDHNVNIEAEATGKKSPTPAASTTTLEQTDENDMTDAEKNGLGAEKMIDSLGTRRLSLPIIQASGSQKEKEQKTIDSAIQTPGSKFGARSLDHKEDGRFLLEKDDAYWDTLSTIASTAKDRSSESEKYLYETVRPGPIPVEITTTTKDIEIKSSGQTSVSQKSRKATTEKEILRSIEAIESLIDLEPTTPPARRAKGFDANATPKMGKRQPSQHNLVLTRTGSILSGDVAIVAPPSHESKNASSVCGDVDAGASSSKESSKSSVANLIAIFESSHSSVTSGTISSRESTGKIIYESSEESDLLLAVTRTESDRSAQQNPNFGTANGGTGTRDNIDVIIDVVDAITTLVDIEEPEGETATTLEEQQTRSIEIQTSFEPEEIELHGMDEPIINLVDVVEPADQTTASCNQEMRSIECQTSFEPEKNELDEIHNITTKHAADERGRQKSKDQPKPHPEMITKSKRSATSRIDASSTTERSAKSAKQSTRSEMTMARSRQSATSRNESSSTTEFTAKSAKASIRSVSWGFEEIYEAPEQKKGSTLARSSRGNLFGRIEDGGPFSHLASLFFRNESENTDAQKSSEYDAFDQGTNENTNAQKSSEYDAFDQGTTGSQGSLGLGDGDFNTAYDVSADTALLSAVAAAAAGAAVAESIKGASSNDSTSKVGPGRNPPSMNSGSLQVNAAADVATGSLSKKEEQELLSRTLQLSKDLLASMSLNDLQGTDEDVVRSLLGLQTSDEKVATHLAEEKMAESHLASSSSGMEPQVFPETDTSLLGLPKPEKKVVGSLFSFGRSDKKAAIHPPPEEKDSVSGVKSTSSPMEAAPSIQQPLEPQVFPGTETLPSGLVNQEEDVVKTFFSFGRSDRKAAIHPPPEEKKSLSGVKSTSSQATPSIQQPLEPQLSSGTETLPSGLVDQGEDVAKSLFSFGMSDKKATIYPPEEKKSISGVKSTSSPMEATPSIQQPLEPQAFPGTDTLPSRVIKQEEHVERSLFSLERSDKKAAMHLPEEEKSASAGKSTSSGLETTQTTKQLLEPQEFPGTDTLPSGLVKQEEHVERSLFSFKRGDKKAAMHLSEDNKSVSAGKSTSSGLETMQTTKQLLEPQAFPGTDTVTSGLIRSEEDVGRSLFSFGRSDKKAAMHLSEDNKSVSAGKATSSGTETTQTRLQSQEPQAIPKTSTLSSGLDRPEEKVARSLFSFGRSNEKAMVHLPEENKSESTIKSKSSETEIIQESKPGFSEYFKNIPFAASFPGFATDSKLHDSKFSVTQYSAPMVRRSSVEDTTIEEPQEVPDTRVSSTGLASVASRDSASDGASQDSPIDVEELLSKYDTLADNLMEQNDQLKSVARDLQNQENSSVKSNRSPIHTKLDTLRCQRAQALARFQLSVTPTGQRSGSSLDMSSKTESDKRNRDRLKYYTIGNTERSRPSSASRACASRTRETTEFSPSVKVNRSQSTRRSRADSYPVDNDIEASSTTSSNASAPSKKARDLRKQLDEALRASQEIRSSQEQLGSELRSFKDRYYKKNDDIEDYAFRALGGGGM